MENLADYSFVIVKRGIKYLVGFFVLFGIALYSSSLILALLSFLILVGLALLFYNPERRPNERGDEIIVAPIDGVVKSIEYQDNQITLTISSPPCFVGILRMPCGELMSFKRMKGFCFCGLNRFVRHMSECVEAVFESGHGRVICRYYPLFSPKNLQLFVPPFPQKGERMGFMPYGVLEISLDSSIHLRVCKGDKIKGGQTTLGIFTHDTH